MRTVPISSGLAAGKFLFSSLHSALNSKVCLCILCAHYGGGFRVGSNHVFAFSSVLVNGIVHVHVYLASGSHIVFVNVGGDGLGPIAQSPLFERYSIGRYSLKLLSLIALDTSAYNRYGCWTPGLQ